LDKIRFAVIGVGGFGQKRIKSIMKSSMAKLSYITDINAKLVEDLSKKLSINVVSLDELSSKKDYDVTIVATPNLFHEELVIKLLKSGKDVWCEKPMAINIESARRMVLESIKNRRILKVGSNPRYFPNTLKASDLIKRKYIGKIMFFRGWIGNEGLHLLNKDWYTKKEMIGGGTLIDNGVHLIDLIRYLAGEIVECFSCKLALLKHNIRELEDNAMAIYELSNGGLALIHSSWTEKTGYMYFELHGEEGFIHVDSRWNKAIIRYGKSGEKPSYEDYTKCPKMSYDFELEDFIKDYRDGFHPKPTSYDGYRAVKIVMQSYVAAQKGSTPTFNSSDLKLKEDFLKHFKVRTNGGLTVEV